MFYSKPEWKQFWGYLSKNLDFNHEPKTASQTTTEGDVRHPGNLRGCPHIPWSISDSAPGIAGDRTQGTNNPGTIPNPNGPAQETTPDDPEPVQPTQGKIPDDPEPAQMTQGKIPDDPEPVQITKGGVPDDLELVQSTQDDTPDDPEPVVTT